MEFSTSRKWVVDELNRGRELIDHLRVMLYGGGDGGVLKQPLVEGLVDKILNTFNISAKVARRLSRKIREDDTREGELLRHGQKTPQFCLKMAMLGENMDKKSSSMPNIQGAT